MKFWMSNVIHIQAGGVIFRIWDKTRHFSMKICLAFWFYAKFGNFLANSQENGE